MGTEVAAPPPPPSGAPSAFDIQRSPFDASPAGADDAAALQAAILAATQPVAGAKRQRPDGGDTVAEPAAPTPPRQGGGKHRPPRPPVLALADSGSLESQAATPGRGGPSPRLAARSPRSPPGGASPASRRVGKPLSKTQGRVCIECAATTTTQWRSQGLLCNSCGVKLIKGRLPMDAESMHRRFQRLPPAIREHPMWEAAQVVAAAQGAAAAAAAAGRPWACPGCNRVGEEKVAGPCGLHQCPRCVARVQPAGGAMAIAAAVAAPPGTLTPSPSPQGGSGSGHKRRKQATPRSAPPAGGLSPMSLSSSSGSSSIWQGGHEVQEGADDATSKDPAPHGRPTTRRLQQLRQGGRAAATPPAAPGRPPYDTPTAAEAAAALLVLTESDEARLAAAVRLDVVDPPAELPLQPAPTMLPGLPTVGAAVEARPESLAEEPSVGPRRPPATPSKEAAAAAASGGEAKPTAARPLHLQLAAAGARAATASGASGASSAVDSMQLYSNLIAASAEPEAAAAGLTAELVGRYLAAHTMPGAGGGGDGAAAAAAARQEQQAQLVGLMLGQRQYTAAVGLMQGVIKLAGLTA